MKRGLDIELMFETIIVQKRKDFFMQIESYEPADLNKPLDRVFYAYSCRLASNKNKQGDNYESKSLKVMTTALEGIKENGYTCSENRNRQFSSSKQAF